MSYYSSYRPTQRQIVSSFYQGTDEDVRNIFFNLDDQSLGRLFRAYGHAYGSGKRKYAEQTYYSWKSGYVRMSGEVSERLIQLLPPLLNSEQKYYLIQKMWYRLQPKTVSSVTVRPDTGVEAAIKLIVETVESRRNFSIPDSLRARLKWLAGDDAKAAELLLKQVFDKEARILREETRVQIHDLFERITRNEDLKMKGSKTLSLAGATIVINVKRTPFYRRWFS